MTDFELSSFIPQELHFPYQSLTSFEEQLAEEYDTHDAKILGPSYQFSAEEEPKK